MQWITTVREQVHWGLISIGFTQDCYTNYVAFKSTNIAFKYESQVVSNVSVELRTINGRLDLAEVPIVFLTVLHYFVGL